MDNIQRALPVGLRASQIRQTTVFPFLNFSHRPGALFREPRADVEEACETFSSSSLQSSPSSGPSLEGGMFEPSPLDATELHSSSVIYLHRIAGGSIELSV